MSKSPESGTKPDEDFIFWNPWDLQTYSLIIAWRLWWGPKPKWFPRTMRRSKKIPPYFEDPRETKVRVRLEKTKNRFMRNTLKKDSERYAESAASGEISKTLNKNSEEDVESTNSEESSGEIN